MVLTVKVGRARPFSTGFWLCVVTFGLYGYFWNIKAHEELYNQFELAREGRETGTVWYVFGFVIVFLRFVYQYRFVSNVQYLRQRFGFQRSMSPGQFLAFVIPAVAGLYVLTQVGIVVIADGLSRDPYTDDLIIDDAKLVTGLVIIAAGGVLYVILAAVAYHKLQTQVNELWASYDYRSAQLMPRAVPTVPVAWPVAATGPVG